MVVLQRLMLMHASRGLEGAPAEQYYESYGQPAEHAGMNIAGAGAYYAANQPTR